MKRIDLYRVIVDLIHHNKWESTFCFPPTVDDLKRTLEFDLVKVEADIEDDDCDESDAEHLSMLQEEMLYARELLLVLEDPQELKEMAGKGWQRVKVAGVIIGRIRVETSEAFVRLKE